MRHPLVVTGFCRIFYRLKVTNPDYTITLKLTTENNNKKKKIRVCPLTINGTP